MNLIPVAVFRLGRIVATPALLERVTHEDIIRAIARHQAGDWGELDTEDRQTNDRAITEGGRLLSVYHAENGVKFYLITEADRSVTTALLPEDY